MRKDKDPTTAKVAKEKLSRNALPEETVDVRRDT